MPINRSPRHRLFIIDRCLRSGREYTSLEIMEEVNAYLATIGQPLVTAKNTIVTDIENIEHIWKAPLSSRRGWKNTIYYKYTDPNFSIFKPQLTAHDLDKLSNIIDTLGKYTGLPHFEWIDEIRAKIHASAYNQAKPIVSFYHSPAYSQNLRHFSPLFDLIKAMTAVELRYKKFNCEEEKMHTVHPYFLKEYLGRWYLVGWTAEHPNKLTSFGLERIISFERSDAPFVENPGFDVEEYFGAMVGLTIPDGAKPEDVEIWVEDKDCPYVESNPIHQSQRYVRDENGGRVYALHLFLNYELEMRLLAYGERLRVLAPDGFRKRMRDRTLAMAEMYEKDDVKSHFSV